MPTVGVFSGVNSGSNFSVNDDTSGGNYMIQMLERWLMNQGHPFSMQYSNNSLFRSKKHLRGKGKTKSVFRLRPKLGLDSEAQEIANDFYETHELCNNVASRVRALLLHPKTTKKPTPGGGKCCDVDMVVAWSPFDKVLNQTYGGLTGYESEEYWSSWGEVHTLDVVGDLSSSFENHSAVKVWNGEAKSVSCTKNWLGRKTWKHGKDFDPKPIVRSWMESDSVDFVFLAHSQGCNILMHVLEKICG